MADTQKELKENERALEHWRTAHDQLALEEIEYVSLFQHDNINWRDVMTATMMKKREELTNLQKAINQRNPRLSQILMPNRMINPNVNAHLLTSCTYIVQRSCQDLSHESCSLMPSSLMVWFRFYFDLVGFDAANRKIEER